MVATKKNHMFSITLEYDETYQQNASAFRTIRKSSRIQRFGYIDQDKKVKSLLGCKIF